MRCRLTTFFSILALCLSMTGAANAAVVRALADSWLVYDTDSRNYLPYDYALHKNTQSISTWLNPRKDNYYLELNMPEGTALYIQNRLWLVVKQKGTVHLKLADVLAIESKSQAPVFLTLYNERGGLDVTKAAIVNAPVSSLLATSLPDQIEPKPLPKQPLRDGAALFLLLILVFYISISMVGGREFMQIFSVADIVANPLDGYGAASRKTLSATNLLLIGANTMAVTYVFYMTDRYGVIAQFLAEKLAVYGLLPLAWVVPLLCFLVGLAYVLGKLVLVQFASTLFQGGRLGTFHFIEFLRFWTLLSLGLMALVVLVYNTFFWSLDFLWQTLATLVFMVFVARMVKVMQVAGSMPEFRLLYLIAYLCTTEIVPMAVLMRYLWSQEV